VTALLDTPLHNILRRAACYIAVTLVMAMPVIAIALRGDA
jgi:hypothetical protein